MYQSHSNSCLLDLATIRRAISNLRSSLIYSYFFMQSIHIAAVSDRKWITDVILRHIYKKTTFRFLSGFVCVGRQSLLEVII
jgi:hypothetical protein